MIINSKKKSLNCILLRKGGDKLFIHKELPKRRLPLISSNYQNNIKLYFNKPFISEIKNYSLENNYLYRNTNNISSNTRTLLSESVNKNDDYSQDINNNTMKQKKKNIAVSVSPEDFSSNEKTLNQLTSSNNGCDNNKTFTTFNNNIKSKYNKGINIIKNNYINYKNNIKISPNLQSLKLEDSITNSTNSLDSILKKKNILKKDFENKEKLKQLIDKKKLAFIKNVLKSNKNFLIDDYLKNKSIDKNKKYLLHNDENRGKFLNNKNGNMKKYGTPILIKDIKIKSLLNNYENKKIKLVKLSPIIIRNEYLRNKFGKDMNKISGINDYELKMNIQKKFKYHINLRNYGNIFDLSKKNSSKY